MSTVLRKSARTQIENTILYILLGCVAISALFPLLYTFIVSITPLTEVARNGGFSVFPKEITWSAYKSVFSSPLVPGGLWVTVQITVIGTLCNLIFTVLLAYPLSRKSLPFRNSILLFLLLTLMFSGGLIPTYLVVNETGLIDTLGALFIPTLISTFYLLIMKSFFESFPDELIEAARIDGLGEIMILVRIILPLSKPILATMGLFYGVSHWNEFFSGIMYINNPKLMPLQVILQNILKGATVTSELTGPQMVVEVPGETIKMALVIVSTLPILLVYPFLQKHFNQGMMLGSVKG